MARLRVTGDDWGQDKNDTLMADDSNPCSFQLMKIN